MFVEYLGMSQLTRRRFNSLILEASAAILAAPRDQVAGLGSRGLVEIGVVR